MDEAVFSKNVIEFVTVSAEFCSFAERVPTMVKSEFTDTSVKLLPLLYLKATLLQPVPSENIGSLEQFVNEETYEYIRGNIERLLGEQDIYLEVFQTDMQYSDTPIAASISENMADIYQDLKDFISIYSLGNEETMRDALSVCQENFINFWGQTLVNVLRALHALRFSPDTDLDEPEALEHNKDNNGNWLFSKRQESWKEESDTDEWDKWNE